jgi:SAM-dependent methyltransferase
MTLSRSGEYTLPGSLYQLLGNSVLRLAPLTPATVQRRYVARWSFYQVSSATGDGDFQGISAHKWEALGLPFSLRGKSVLDIGCSEGYFAQKCAERGAGPVVGVDASLGRLLTAQFMSQANGLTVRYRMGLFPGSAIEGSFDYVLCLSVIHHSCVKKDMWKVLVEPQYADDLEIVRGQLSILRRLTVSGGTCLLEVPYEYDDPVEERRAVDFQIFASELMTAGFTTVKCLGSWDYNPKHKAFKDRIIYAAEA